MRHIHHPSFFCLLSNAGSQQVEQSSSDGPLPRNDFQLVMGNQWPWQQNTTQFQIVQPPPFGQLQEGESSPSPQLVFWFQTQCFAQGWARCIQFVALHLPYLFWFFPLQRRDVLLSVEPVCDVRGQHALVHILACSLVHSASVSHRDSCSFSQAVPSPMAQGLNMCSSASFPPRSGFRTHSALQIVIIN